MAATPPTPTANGTLRLVAHAEPNKYARHATPRTPTAKNTPSHVADADRDEHVPDEHVRHATPSMPAHTA